MMSCQSRKKMGKWLRRKMTSSFLVVCKNCWEKYWTSCKQENRKEKEQTQKERDAREACQSRIKMGKWLRRKMTSSFLVVCKNCWEKYWTSCKQENRKGKEQTQKERDARGPCLYLKLWSSFHKHQLPLFETPQPSEPSFHP